MSFLQLLKESASSKSNPIVFFINRISIFYFLFFLKEVIMVSKH